jgi:hypothetical protein
MNDIKQIVEVRLTHGHHRYLFLVAGVPTLNPQATEAARNNNSANASVIAVS